MHQLSQSTENIFKLMDVADLAVSVKAKRPKLSMIERSILEGKRRELQARLAIEEAHEEAIEWNIALLYYDSVGQRQPVRCRLCNKLNLYPCVS